MTKARRCHLLAGGLSAALALSACSSTTRASSRIAPGSGTETASSVATSLEANRGSGISSRPTPSSDSIAGVPLYVSDKGVRQLLGAPRKRTRFGLLEVWDYPHGLTVWTAAGPGVIRIEANAAGPPTDTGIKIGSTPAQLRRAYGDQLSLDNVEPTLRGYSLSVTRADTYWSFFLRDHSVRLIHLTCRCTEAGLLNNEGPVLAR